MGNPQGVYLKPFPKEDLRGISIGTDSRQTELSIFLL